MLRTNRQTVKEGATDTTEYTADTKHKNAQNNEQWNGRERGRRKRKKNKLTKYKSILVYICLAYSKHEQNNTENAAHIKCFMINMNYNEENFMYSFLPSRSSFPPENSECKAKKKWIEPTKNEVEKI